MADISSITLPDSSSYNLKDEEARKGIVYFGVCGTAAGTQTKAVTIDGITEYFRGMHIRVLFTYAQTYNGVPKLNINGLGAKNIARAYGTNAARYEWVAQEVLDLVYVDGNETFLIVDGGIATTTYYGVTKLYTGAASTSTSVSLTPASLYNLCNGSIAPYYSASATYDVGDKVRYGNILYECNTAITTAEAWTDAHWTALPTLLKQIDNISGSNFVNATTPSFSSLPQTFYNANITASHEVVGNAVHLSYPKAGDIDWNITCANGSLTISGTFHGSTATTATMSLWIPAKTITLTTS